MSEIRNGPLAGIRVVDVSWMWAGPLCATVLGYLGAEVIRVESHDHPCMTRVAPPYPDDRPGLNRAGGFHQLNQGKKSLALDLKRPAAIDVARDLIRISDVFIENFAVGVIDRLGLGYEAVSVDNAGLVMLSLSGYGQTGPLRNRVAFGPPLTMMSGLGALSGLPSRGPTEVGISYSDPNGGLHGAFAVLAALWQCEETGEGQYIDLSQLESLVALLPEGILPFAMNADELPRMGNHDLFWVPHGIYRCLGDDQWLSIVIRDDAEWQRLSSLLGPDVAADERFRTRADRKTHEEELDKVVTAWTAKHDAGQTAEKLQRLEIAASVCLDMQMLANDDHMNARDYFVRLDHPEVGRYQLAGIPWKLHGSKLQVQKAAPCLGEDNEYVICELLGRTAAEYNDLLTGGILH